MQTKLLANIHLSELLYVFFINVINLFQLMSNIMDFFLFEELKISEI